MLLEEKADAKGGEAGYGGTTVYGVAVVDGAFFARTGSVLYRIGKR